MRGVGGVLEGVAVGYQQTVISLGLLVALHNGHCDLLVRLGLPLVFQARDSPRKMGGSRVCPQGKSHEPGSKEGLGGLPGRRGVGGQTVQGTCKAMERPVRI